jgi:hypothetical protein
LTLAEPVIDADAGARRLIQALEVAVAWASILIAAS